MNQLGSTPVPALFRAGDIGVSSEWRDISYDWSPILTAYGVFIYSYLRDTYDQQRSLRPFILTPEGPTKKSIQHKLGLKSAYAMQGPEYLLCTVGLLHVEVGYGSSNDPERPNNTHVTYYVVGRLDHPVLDWPMLARVLDALQLALDAPSPDKETAARQRRAQAALRSLGQAGLLQDADPADVFYPFGTWPTLLPTLVHDERWIALFTHLHGADAVLRYRQQARAWVEYAQRSAARLMQENQAIAEQLLAAQRRGPQGAPGGGSIPRGGPEFPASAPSPTATASQIPVTSAGKPIEVTYTGFVTGESLASHQPIEVTYTGSVTPVGGSHREGINPGSRSGTAESLAVDQLTLSSSRERIGQPSDSVTRDGDKATAFDNLPLVEPHLHDAELTSTRFDAYFWCAVNQILCGTNERYSATAGEKQAVFRQFKRQEIPIGVVLAALRAVMTLSPPQRPRSFSDALKLDTFHACVQQALALLPTRAAAVAAVGTWPEFLQTYRSVGQASGLRNVSTSDYHVLYALFARQPSECWEVLNRVEHTTQPPDLSPAYLRRAIVNNQQAAAQQALLPVEQTTPCRRATSGPAEMQLPSSTGLQAPSDDPRSALLVREGVPTQILTDDITEEYLRLWIAEADARHEEIYSRPGWLRWGIESGHLPSDHPQLRPRPKRSAPSARDSCSRTATGAGTPSPAPEEDPYLRTLWQAALGALEVQLPRTEFETWIKGCQLVALDPGVTLDEATLVVIATPNIFVRQEVEALYQGAISAALGAQLKRTVEVRCVIAQV